MIVKTMVLAVVVDKVITELVVLTLQSFALVVLSNAFDGGDDGGGIGMFYS